MSGTSDDLEGFVGLVAADDFAGVAGLAFLGVVVFADFLDHLCTSLAVGTGYGSSSFVRSARVMLQFRFRF